ncbi:MAG: fibrillarin-like rRNA/tRNA 2'-O-methyltransferase [Candidatus Aenigmatarchaeota archaeon]
MRQVTENCFQQGNELFTVNLVPGTKVYGEELRKDKTGELRVWDPNRSKLGAAILKGLKTVPMTQGSKILYLGASTGTTVSHISDIIGQNGLLYGLEFAERVFRGLLELSKNRKNIAPLMADARKIEEYPWVEECDIVFTDISQPEEVVIFIRNCNEFLKPGGYGMIAIKSRSIDVIKTPGEVYKDSEEKLKNAGYKIIEIVDLEPYEKDHALIVVQR